MEYNQYESKLHQRHDRLNPRAPCQALCPFIVPAASEEHFPQDSATYAATQEACSCFRQQIFTERRAKENVSVHKNKVGGEDLWKCCCASECFFWTIFFSYKIHLDPKLRLKLYKYMGFFYLFNSYNFQFVTIHMYILYSSNLVTNYYTVFTLFFINFVYSMTLLTHGTHFLTCLTLDLKTQYKLMHVSIYTSTM